MIPLALEPILSYPLIDFILTSTACRCGSSLLRPPLHDTGRRLPLWLSLSAEDAVPQAAAQHPALLRTAARLALPQALQAAAAVPAQPVAIRPAVRGLAT